MIVGILRSCMAPWAKATKIVLVLFLCLAAEGSIVRADTTPAPPHEDFGQYLVNHQDDLGPFFEKNSGVLIGDAVPLVLQWIGQLMLIVLIVGWVLDVFLGRGFSMLFAPSLAKTSRACIYAAGRLVLSVLLAVLLGVIVTFVAGIPHLAVVLTVLAILFVLGSAALQVGWIYYLYRTDIFISLLFYLTLVVVHAFAALAIAAPTLGARAGASVTGFMDHTVAAKVEDEVRATKQELATVTPARDEATGQAADLQQQIDRAKADQVRLQQEIEAKKDSAEYLFSQIVKVHAGGDLETARARFTDFLARFPADPLTGLAKGQLIQINSEIAAQAVQKKQDEANALRAAAQARADLLTRAAKGQVTLSQMRSVLLGKTRKEVDELLGPPTETASDRWGFAQQMIVNPLTNERSGLAVIFVEGTVQGVDYYYGKAGTQ
jgi:hypothetical protein